MSIPVIRKIVVYASELSGHYSNDKMSISVNNQNLLAKQTRFSPVEGRDRFTKIIRSP
jgi:hypothetical protein